MNKLNKILLASLLFAAVTPSSFAEKASCKGFNGAYVGLGLGIGKGGTRLTKEAKDGFNQSITEILTAMKVEKDLTLRSTASSETGAPSSSSAKDMPKEKKIGLIEGLEFLAKEKKLKISAELFNSLKANVDKLDDYLGKDTKAFDILEKVSINKSFFRAELLFGYDYQLKSNLILGIQFGLAKNFGGQKYSDIDLIKDLTKIIPDITKTDALNKSYYKNKFEINIRLMVGYALTNRFAMGFTPGLAIKLNEFDGTNKTTVGFMPGLRMVFKATDSLEIGLQTEAVLKSKLDKTIETKTELRGTLSINYRL